MSDTINDVKKRNTLTVHQAWEDPELFDKQISKDKLYAELKAGRIPSAKIGSKYLMRRETIENWFREQEQIQDIS